MLGDETSRIVRFLRWSEKYTKTDMVYLVSGAGLSVVGQGAGIIASLGFAIAVNHFLEKETYGTYKFILSIVAILSLFSLTGIGSAVLQSAAQGYNSALTRGFWENIRWSFAVFVGGLAVALYYFLNGNNSLATGVLIGASFSPFIASASLFGPFLGGKKDFWHQTVYGIADNIFPIFILIGVVLVTSDPVLLVGTYFITNLLAALFFYGRTLEKYPPDLNHQDQGFSRYSKHLSAMGVISGLANNLDQVLLFHYVGAVQLAIYNFAIAIPEQIKGPSKNLSTMIQAQFATRTNKEIRHGMANKVTWISILAAALAILYIISAPLVFKVLFPNYIDAVWYSQIYALSILAIPFETFTTYLVSKKLARELYISYVSYSFFQISTMLIGVIYWGLPGLVWARVLTRFLMGISGYILYRRAVVRASD